MKIEGKNQLPGAGAVGRARGGREAGTRFSVGGDGVAAARTAAGPSGASSVAALIALQEVPDATARRARAVAAGHDLLDRLDELRLALLAGRMSPNRLAALAQSARARREGVADPRLAEVLDEIALRAEVELAKLGF